MGALCSGASRKERESGIAVSGKWHQKVTFPEGVYGEQMKGGMRPAKSFLTFTPTLIAEMLERKGAKELYDEFEHDVALEGGGDKLTGWKSSKIYAVVQRYQDKFKEKGISVSYHMVSWYQYVHNQYGGHHQVHYKYWMEYGDLDIMNGDIPLADVYDPSKDYANPDKNEKNPLTGKSANEAA